MARFRQLLVVFCILCALPACAGAAEVIIVSNSWIAAAPPTAKTLAAYLTISNHADREVRLLGAESPDFAEIALHATTMEGGMMHMTALPELVIAPGASASLSPGSCHLMLHGPKRPLKIGDRVELTLRFDHGKVLTVTAEVRRR